MDKLKITETVLRNSYKNVQMALHSLDDVIEKASDKLKEELISQREGYEKHATQISLVANQHNIPLSDVTGFKKTMLSASIEMKTIADNSSSHLAEMTLKGTVMGVTELIKDISEFGHLLDSDVLSAIEKLKDFEEEAEKNLKKYL